MRGRLVRGWLVRWFNATLNSYVLTHTHTALSTVLHSLIPPQPYHPNLLLPNLQPPHPPPTTSSFSDDPRTLREKVKLLASLLRRRENALAYTGAGISTASGIGDYATRAGDGATLATKPKLRSPWEAQPTKAHRVLAALYDEKVLKHWNQVGG